MTALLQWKGALDLDPFLMNSSYFTSRMPLETRTFHEESVVPSRKGLPRLFSDDGRNSLQLGLGEYITFSSYDPKLVIIFLPCN